MCRLPAILRILLPTPPALHPAPPLQMWMAPDMPLWHRTSTLRALRSLPAICPAAELSTVLRSQDLAFYCSLILRITHYALQGPVPARLLLRLLRLPAT